MTFPSIYIHIVINSSHAGTEHNWPATISTHGGEVGRLKHHSFSFQELIQDDRYLVVDLMSFLRFRSHSRRTITDLMKTSISSCQNVWCKHHEYKSKETREHEWWGCGHHRNGSGLHLVRLQRATGHKDTEECEIRSISVYIYVMDDEDELKPRSKCCLCEIVSSIYYSYAYHIRSTWWSRLSWFPTFYFNLPFIKIIVAWEMYTILAPSVGTCAGQRLV